MTVRIWAVEDVTVEVRAAVDHGDVEVGGVERPDGTFTIGPDGRTGRRRPRSGRARRDHCRFARARRTPDSTRPTGRAGPTRSRSERIVAEGVVLSRGGLVVLADGEAVIDLDGNVLTGSTERRGGIVVIPTSLGEFQLLPDDLLLTPFGDVLELPALTGGG